MKSIWAAIFLCIGVGTGVGPVSAASNEEVMVLFEPGTPESVQQHIIEDRDGEVVDSFDHADAVTAELPKNERDGLLNRKEVQAVSVKQHVKSLVQHRPWGVTRIGAPTAWSSGYTGKKVKIAILDSGISPHPDLLIRGGKSFVDYTTRTTDDHGHGTHVAGIIASLNNTIGYVGAAYDSELYALKVLDRNGEGDTWALAEAIDWSITNRMDIIHLSLGFEGEDPIIEELVNRAREKGILVVAAAGNEGYGRDTLTYPAKYDAVISVGSVNQAGQRSTFSSTGPMLDVVAPGEEILSTIPGPTYAKWEGTSMAAPFVSAQLALMKEAYPTATASALRQMLITNTSDLGAPGWDPLYGHGLIKAFKLPASKPFVHTITVYESVMMYQEPSTTKPIRTVTGVQAVTEEKGGWLKRAEGGWIRPTLYQIGSESKISGIVNIPQPLVMKTAPLYASKTVGTAPAGPIEVDKRIGAWVHWKQKNVWIRTINEPVYPWTPGPKTITLLATSNLYPGPSSLHGKTGSLPPGPVSIEGTWKHWIRVKGQWMSPPKWTSERVLSTLLSYQIVKPARMTLVPAVNKPSVGTLPAGRVVKGSMIYGSWTLVMDGTRPVWVESHTLRKAVPLAPKKSVVVKKGDTLYGIAKTNKVSVSDLVKWNRLSSTGLRVGQTLVVSH